MKKQYVKDLTDGALVETDFVVRRKELRLGRSGRVYLALELADGTGFLQARLFDGAEETAEGFAEGDYVGVRGALRRYNGRRELVVQRLVRLDPETVEAEDFLPSSHRPVDELVGFLEFLAEEVHDLHLGRLLSLFLSDPGFMAAFTKAPAAKTHHHAYLGGLLEHTVSVATLCEHAAQQYPCIDRDLLVTAAILHDVGKVRELEYGAKIDYTDEGRFVGHLIIGERMVAERIERIQGFPEDLALRLRHAILSHHGELEWGSPKRPSTLEALVLHHVDNLDAKVAGFGEIVRRYPGQQVGWTDVQNLFRRPLHRPRPVEDEDRVAEEAGEYE